MAACFAFEGFVLDTDDRRLRRGGQPVELSARYLDALALLVRHNGGLVTKDRFLDEVWAGVPVTDEALTQCIKTLRRQLGDSASQPRFIETVPKHGYRFIAPIQSLDGTFAASSAKSNSWQWRHFVATGITGTIGGGVAGAIGGFVYGLAGASQPMSAGMGSISVLLVLLSVTTLVALLGAAGVSFGLATAVFARAGDWQWSVIGGAGGGLLIGTFGKLLGLDSFTLLVGHSPGAITGGGEGALLGGAVGLAAWLASRSRSAPRAIIAAAACGLAAGLVIGLTGGRLMLGSLAALSGGFPGSHLDLDQISQMFGEARFGPVTRIVSGCLEAALFAGCIVAALFFARSGDSLQISES
jgi:DNA-binding winged helix-turn-helix (wHTH) protein